MIDIIEMLTRDPNALGQGLRHASTALDIVKKLKALTERPKLPSREELQPLVTELMQQIMDTKLANMELQEQLLQFKQAALDAEKLQNKLDRYELWETASGSLVYRLKEEHAKEQPKHYACPKCYENAHISILQGGQHEKRCRVCEKFSNVYFFEPKPEAKRVKRTLNADFGSPHFNDT